MYLHSLSASRSHVAPDEVVALDASRRRLRKAPRNPTLTDRNVYDNLEEVTFGESFHDKLVEKALNDIQALLGPGWLVTPQFFALGTRRGLGCLSVSDWGQTYDNEYRGSVTVREEHNTHGQCEVCGDEQQHSEKVTRLVDWLQNQEEQRSSGLGIAGSAFAAQV